ncbi:MAG: hypothetical protein IT548_05050 [Alphaproteobacteria bacterium]|nr:hypothetical protein [Alphaproteobacteria bacterium]
MSNAIKTSARPYRLFVRFIFVHLVQISVASVFLFMVLLAKQEWGGGIGGGRTALMAPFSVVIGYSFGSVLTLYPIFSATVIIFARDARVRGVVHGIVTVVCGMIFLTSVTHAAWFDLVLIGVVPLVMMAVAGSLVAARAI